MKRTILTGLALALAASIVGLSAVQALAELAESDGAEMDLVKAPAEIIRAAQKQFGGTPDVQLYKANPNIAVIAGEVPREAFAAIGLPDASGALECKIRHKPLSFYRCRIWEGD